MEELRSKVAVVTGGASGIGHGLVGAFGAEGMKVVVADLDETRLKSVVDAARVALDMLAGRLAIEGIPAEEAGAIVVDAVKRNQFWILPNGGAHLPSVQQDLDELFASA